MQVVVERVAKATKVLRRKGLEHRQREAPLIVPSLQAVGLGLNDRSFVCDELAIDR